MRTRSAGITDRSLAITAVVVILLPMALPVLGLIQMDAETSYIIVLGDYLLLAVATLVLAALVMMKVAQSWRSPYLGRGAAAAAITALPIAVVIPSAINALTAGDLPVAPLLAAWLCALWIVWAGGASTLVVTWMVASTSRFARRDSSPQSHKPTHTRMPPWSEDTEGSD